jgi:hypothetical protein
MACEIFLTECCLEYFTRIVRDEHMLRVFENRVLRKIFRPDRDEAIGSGENYINKSFIISITHQILFG